MHIMHVALGGCLRPPPVDYGVTQDTGGHIAYVLGAAIAQSRQHPGARISIVTRAFDDPSLGADHAMESQRVSERIVIRRLRTGNPNYLTKGALSAELPALQQALFELIGHDRPDVLHAHFADAAELALAVRERWNIPVLYTPHSLALDKGRHCRSLEAGAEHRARLRREFRVIDACDRIIVSSQDERRLQVGGYEAGAMARTVVARPGVSLAFTTGTDRAKALIDPLLDEPGRPFLLAIARPVPKKNLPALLKAYAGDPVLQSLCNLVILAGQHARIRLEQDEQSEELDRLHSLRFAYALDGKVALPCRHDAIEVAQLYRLAVERRGLFVNPARHEPFGLTLIEAAHCGLPVVATSRGGPREILATIGHGRLVDPADEPSLARTCRVLLDETDAYAAATRSAARHARTYGWAAWAATVARTMEQLIGPDSSAKRRPRPVHDSVLNASAQRASPATRPHDEPDVIEHFLACDIDDTLTGCVDGASRFGRWMAGHEKRAARFAVATGRELPEAVAVIRTWKLPRPSVWITSVGTEIWRPAANGRLVRCPCWAERLSAGWDRDAIVATLRALPVHYQEPRTQRPWKISLFGDSDQATMLANLPALQAFDVRIVASHGRFIDLIPGRAGKAAAIEFEAARRQLSMGQCIAAGDSGNDVDMLSRCGRAILVGNALPETAQVPARPALHRAFACHADGVLEGLAAFGLVSAHELPAHVAEAVA